MASQAMEVGQRSVQRPSSVREPMVVHRPGAPASVLALALAVLVSVTTHGGCKKAGYMERPSSPAVMKTMEPSRKTFFLSKKRVIKVKRLSELPLDKASELLARLKAGMGKDPHCNGTLIDSSLLLTAAHCIDGVSKLDLTSPLVSLTVDLKDREIRSCMFDPGCQRAHVTQPDRDIVTLFVGDLPHEGLPAGHITGVDFPHMVFWKYGSAGAAQHYLICEAEAVGEGVVYDAEAQTEPGDSGGPLVGFLHDNGPVILGVISTRDESKWMFTPVPEYVDFPIPRKFEGTAAATYPQEWFGSYDTKKDFLKIEECGGP